MNTTPPALIELKNVTGTSHLAFKREAVQLLMAKNLAEITYRWKPFLPFKRELQTANVTGPQGRGHVTT